jgi:hypothetical protein
MIAVRRDQWRADAVLLHERKQFCSKKIQYVASAHNRCSGALQYYKMSLARAPLV